MIAPPTSCEGGSGWEAGPLRRWSKSASRIRSRGSGFARLKRWQSRLWGTRSRPDSWSRTSTH